MDYDFWLWLKDKLKREGLYDKTPAEIDKLYGFDNLFTEYSEAVRKEISEEIVKNEINRNEIDKFFS